MAIRLTTTKQAAVLNGIKLLVYGASGVGKTTLCATTGAPTVIISAEAGLLSLRGHDIPVIEVASMADMHEAYAFLTQSEEAKDFQWVCLDSLSEIAEVCLAGEKAAVKDPRQAYGALQDAMGGLIRAFRDLPGRHVCMTAKLDRVKDEVSGGLFYGPSMPGQRLGQALPYYFDEVFALRLERDAEGNPSRWLQTQPDTQWSAKERSGCLEQFEQPNLAAVAAKILQPQTQPNPF